MYTYEEILLVGKRPYLLGIDGGGTKTALVLTDGDMQVLRRVETDACNPMDCGFERATVILREAIEEICAGIDYASVVLFAGIAGGISGGMQARLHAFFSTFGFAAFANDSDTKNGIAAGLGKNDGISVIMGTGICVFAQKDGVLTRVGGWGYLLDDGGSGYNIGRDGLAAYYRALDGSGEKTILRDWIAHDHPNPQALLGMLYAGGKRIIASFAPLVYRAAEEGDAVADAIIRRNMAYAAHLIRTAGVAWKNGTVPVVLAGGLLSHSRTMRELYAALGEEKNYDLRIIGLCAGHGCCPTGERYL